MTRRVSYLIIGSVVGASLALMVLAHLGPVGTVSGATLEVGPGGDYQTIQSAIDNATPGDEIKICAGHFNESLTVNRSITLTGVSRTDTVVRGNGTGSVVMIYASKVRICGIGVEGSGGESGDAGFKMVSASNCSLEQVSASNINGSGVVLYDGCTGTTITNSTFQSNKGHGIMFSTSCSWNTIVNNTCDRNGQVGIYLVKRCSTNTISGNTCNHNDEHGIWIDNQCMSNDIVGNDCLSNARNGIAVTDRCERNRIVRNACLTNGANGVRFHFICTYNWAENNRLDGNKGDGIFTFEGCKRNHFHNNSCCNNSGIGIRLRHSDQNTQLVNNTCNDNGDCGIHVSWNSCASTMRENECNNNGKHGIYIMNYFELDGTLLQGNTCNDNDVGILLASGNIRIVNNTIKGNRIGIDVGSFKLNRVINNTVISNRGIGINGAGRFNVYQGNRCALNDIGIIGSGVETRFEDNTCYRNERSGIAVRSSTICLVRNNTCYENENGITLSSLTSFTVELNNCTSNALNGLTLRSCSDGQVCNNTLARNVQHGLVLESSSSNNTVWGNTCTHQGGSGILILGPAHLITVESNTVSDSRLGVSLNDTHNDTVTRNRVYSNDIGIDLDGSRDCTVFDNWLESTVSHRVVASSNVSWNVSKTPGVSITGTGFLGGNYWSDYEGVDLDGDMLGDTMVPHGPGDFLPLIRYNVLPQIDDLTTGSPTTGDHFEIRARIREEWRIESAWVQFRYGDGPSENASMDLGRDGIWRSGITIRRDFVGPFLYVIVASDFSMNINSTPPRSLTVVDNDEPVIRASDLPDTVGTGDLAVIGADVHENVAIHRVWMDYWFGEGPQTSVSMNNRVGDLWEYVVEAPMESLEALFFMIHASDASGLSNETGVLTVEVVDNDYPKLTLDNCQAEAELAHPYYFDISVVDNIGVLNAWVEHWYGSKQPISEPMERRGDLRWTLTLALTSDITKWIYILWAEDTSGNRAALVTREFWLVDDEGPTFDRDRSPTVAYTGDTYTFEVDVRDAIGVSTVDVEWGLGLGPLTSSAMVKSLTDTWTFEIDIPPDSEDYAHYTFHAKDVTGNWNSTEKVFVQIVDDDEPTFGPDQTLADQNTEDDLKILIEVFDNIRIAEVRVDLTLPGGDQLSYSMTAREGGEYAYCNDHEKPGVYIYVINTRDNSGNVNSTTARSINVTDTTPPVLGDLVPEPRNPVEGGSVVFTISIHDNGRIAEVVLLVVHPDGSREEVPMTLHGGEEWKAAYIVRDAGKHFYSVTVEDGAGNLASSMEYPMTVPPKVEERGGMGTYGYLALVVVIIVIVAATMLLWRRRGP